MALTQQLKNWSRSLHFVACAFLIIGVCCSKFLMSMGLLLGGLSFVTSGEINSSLKRLIKNPFFLMLGGFYFLHLMGLIWSDNLSYGFNDIRQKSSLLIIPIILLSRSDWGIQKIDRLLILFLATLFITSLINFITYTFFKGEMALIDIRSMSLFESHIRFGILIGLGSGVALYFIGKYSTYKILLIVLIVWFGVYSYQSQVLSGILSYVISLVTFLLFYSKKYKNNFAFYSLITLPFCCLIGLIFYFQSPVEYSEVGAANTSSLEKAWNNRSTIKYLGKDAKDQSIKYTLIRYLDSKKLQLDSTGINSLSKDDIQNIELGYADVRETQGGIPARLFSIRYEIQHPGNPNLHPITERLELWENAWYTIKKTPFLGVGNGDVHDALQVSYNERKSELTTERRLRAHQSYLTFWLSFGIIGLFAFIWLQGYFILRAVKSAQLVALCFGLIALCTFLFEDTLESQAGITFFAFFYSLFSIHLSKHK
jgi:hypothetical protein